MADPFADLDAAAQPADPFADLDAQQQPAADPFADLDAQEQAPAPGTAADMAKNHPIQAAINRGLFRLTQLGHRVDAATLGRLPGTAGEYFRERAARGVASDEQNIQSLPKQADRSWDAPGIAPKIASVVDNTLESAAIGLPAIAAAAATGGLGTVPVMATLGLTSGATEYGSSELDYLRQQGVDLTKPEEILRAQQNPEMMAAAKAYAAKRGGVVGAVDALTLGVSKGAAGTMLRAGRPVAAAGAGLAVEAMGGAAGEAGAQVATEGRVTDWGAVRDEALGELLPGAAEVVSATREGGARAASEFHAGPVESEGKLPPGPVSEGIPPSDPGSPKGAGPAPVVPLTSDPYAPPTATPAPVVPAAPSTPAAPAKVKTDPFADLDVQAGLSQGPEPVPGYEPLAGIGPKEEQNGVRKPETGNTAPRSLADILAELGNTPGAQPLATSGEQGGSMGGTEVDPEVWYGATSRESGGGPVGRESTAADWSPAQKRAVKKEARTPEPVKQGQPFDTKAAQGQKKWLLAEVDKAIEAAQVGTSAAERTAVFLVPGDGEFRVPNDAKTLAKFREKAAKQFPTTPGASPAVNLPSTKAPATPALGKLTPESALKVAARFTSADPSRKVMAAVYSEGDAIVATNGRSLIRIKQGGMGDNVQVDSRTGKPIVRTDGDYPMNYKQILNLPRERIAEGLDAGRLGAQVSQAVAAVKDQEGNLPPVGLYLNKDGTVGVMASVKNQGEYSHNVQPDAQLLAHFDGALLEEVLGSHRNLGAEQVSMDSVKIGQDTAFWFGGPTADIVLMPIRAAKIEGFGKSDFAPDRITPSGRFASRERWANTVTDLIRGTYKDPRQLGDRAKTEQQQRQTAAASINFDPLRALDALAEAEAKGWVSPEYAASLRNYYQTINDPEATSGERMNDPGRSGPVSSEVGVADWEEMAKQVRKPVGKAKKTAAPSSPAPPSSPARKRGKALGDSPAGAGAEVVLYDNLDPVVKDDIENNIAEKVSFFVDNNMDYVDAKANLRGMVDEPALLIRDVPIRSITGYNRNPSDSVVREYASRIKMGSLPPPILVDGNKFVDGGHRYAAHILAGRRTIRVVDVGPLLHMDWAKYLKDELPAPKATLDVPRDKRGKALGDSPGGGRSVGAGPLDSGADRVESQPVGGLPTARTRPATGTIAGQDTVRVPFALPELLKLVRGVGLSVPKIYESLRGRGGLATIYPAGSTPVGDIKIEANRARVIQPKEETALRAQAGDEAQLEADAMTAAAALGGPPVPQDFLAKRTEELYKELYAARLDWAKVNRGQEALARTVSHELGHIGDALPPGDFSRGNILGRFFHAAKYLKTMMSVHPSGMGNILSNADRSRLQRQAEKAAGPKPTDPAALAAWKTARKNAYTNLLDAEAGKRGLIQIKDVVRETDPLIAWWRGEEKIPDYYRTPWERYAELMSMYALAPGQFQTRAPMTYATLNNWLERNPEYKRPFDELHKKIETGEHIGEFERELEASFDQSDRDAVAIQEGRDRPTWGEIKDSFLVTFDRVRGPVLRRVDSLRKTAPEVYERVKGALKNWQYKDNANKAVVDRVKRFQAVSLAPADITWRRFGTYLFLRRVLNERYNLANPLGTDSKRATIVLEKWRNDMGAERFAALERAGQEFNALHQQVLDYIEKTGTERPELWAKLKGNDAYATFSVLPDEIAEAGSLEEMLGTAMGTAPGAGVRKQVGTFRRVENPATATMKKWMQWMNHADRMVAIREVAKMARDHFDEAQPANVRFIDGRPQPLEKTGARVGTLMWRENGRVMAAYVPKGLADAFNDRSGSNPVTSAVRWAAGTYQALHTAWNPAFWPVGFAKDVMGTVARVPGMRWLGDRGIVRQLRPALKSAWSLHFGVADATAMRAMDRRMLQGLRDSGLFNENDAGIERLMRQFGQVSLGQTRRPEVKGFLDSWNRMGQVFEHAVKIAGMTWADANLQNLSEEARRELVRVNVGSPEFGDRGTAAPYLNFLFPFLNAAKQGWRQQIEARHAFESNTEYALKLITYSIAPRLALAAAAAAMWRDDDEREAAYASIPARDKRLNLVLPLGWYDKAQKKVAYIRIPQDETSALIGGLVETLMDRNSRNNLGQSAAQFVSSRFAPGDNNLMGIPGVWLNYYVNGQVSTDPFTNRPIMSEKRADAGGMWAAEALAKHSFNQLPDIVRLPLGMTPFFPGRFDVSDRPEVKRGMLEELTRLPGASRFLRVSNAGLLDVAKPAVEGVRKARARQLLTLQSAAADYQPGQPLGDDLRAALAGKEDREYFRNQIRKQRLREANPVEEMLYGNRSKAEVAAVRKAMAEVAPPAD